MSTGRARGVLAITLTLLRVLQTDSLDHPMSESSSPSLRLKRGTEKNWPLDAVKAKSSEPWPTVGYRRTLRMPSKIDPPRPHWRAYLLAECHHRASQYISRLRG